MIGAADDVVVVNYHYCQPLDNGVFTCMATVRPEMFATQLESMRAHFRPLRASEVPAARLLSRLDAGAQQMEIETPLLFQDLLGDRAFAHSHHDGVRNSFNDTTKTALTDLGIGMAFTLGRRIHRFHHQCDLLENPRFDVNDVFDAQGEFIIAEAA